MSLVESRGALSKGFRDLSNRWAEVHSVWHDTQSETFEREYLLTIETEVRKATAALDHMNAVLHKIVTDCE